MVENRISFIKALVRQRFVKIGGSVVLAVGGYDSFSSQFDLPKLGKVVGMSGSLLPWWGWLLALQAIFVYALFEYVRKLRNGPVLETHENRNLEVSKEILEGIGRLENRTNLVEKSLRELEVNKVLPLERLIKPGQGGLLSTLLVGPDKSRFDQIEEKINQSNEAIAALGKRIDLESKYQKSLISIVSNALSAHYARVEISRCDNAFSSLTPRLLDAHKEIYETEDKWLAEYQEWERAVSRIDEIVTMWDQRFHRFLDLDRSHFHNMDAMPPSNSAITSLLTNRWYTVFSVEKKYKESRLKIFEYFENKSRNLPIID